MGLIHSRKVPLLSRARGCVAAWSTDRYGPSHSGALVRDFISGRFNAQYGSGSGSDSNDPTLYTPDRGRWYAVFPGVGGNYFSRSVPSGWAGKNSGTFSLRARVYFDSVTPGTSCGTHGADGQRLYLILQTNGTLRLRVVDGGGAGRLHDSTSAVPFAASAWVWVRADYNFTGPVVQFYTSSTDTDDETAVSWTKLGNDVTGLATAINGSLATLVAGSSNNGTTFPHSGGVRQVSWWLDGSRSTGIDLTDGRNYNSTQTSVLGLSGTNWTTTRVDGTGRTLVIVDSPMLSMGTDDYLLVAHDAVFNPGGDGDLTAFAIVRMWQVSGTGIVIGKKATTGSGDAGWSVEFSSAEAPVARVSDGTNQVTATGTAPTVGIARVAGIRLRRSAQTVEVFTVAADGALGLASASISSVGAITNSVGLTMGADPSAGSRYSGVHKGGGYFNRALTDAELRQLPRAMNAGFVGF